VQKETDASGLAAHWRRFFPPYKIFYHFKGGAKFLQSEKTLLYRPLSFVLQFYKKSLFNRSISSALREKFELSKRLQGRRGA
jgi:hypothetical protein